MPLALNRNEVAGAFGDFGTFVPLVLGMVTTLGLDLVTILVLIGVFYIASAILFRAPLPIQPMKAIAALAITGGISFGAVRVAGFALGIIFTVLAIVGFIGWLAKVIPRSVVLGVQVGLGLKLMATSAGMMSAPVKVTDIVPNWVYVVASIFAILALRRSRVPAMFAILGIGITPQLVQGYLQDLVTPNLSIPKILPLNLDPTDLLAGVLFLAIPQIPLTIGNSILATESLSRTLFPRNRAVTAKRLSISVGAANLASSILGGIPICHGAGGLAGHYRFGARTHTATLFMGSLLVATSLLYGGKFAIALRQIPIPVLGVILFFAALQLILLIKHVKRPGYDPFTTVLTAIICPILPYGFTLGMIVGCLTFFIRQSDLKEALRKRGEPNGNER